jgi:hypothetical protein
VERNEARLKERAKGGRNKEIKDKRSNERKT